MSLRELVDLFQAPANEQRVVPLLRINDAIDEQKLRRQIRSLREQGCGGIFSICERFGGGAEEPFVSEWWWKVVGWMATACAEEGIQFWAYDDEDWPSGSVGGQLPAKHPEHNWKYLWSEEHALAGGETLELDLSGKQCAGAAAWRTEGGEPVPGSMTSVDAGGGTLRWTAPAGAGWTVALYTARPGKGFFLDGLADLMDESACAQFIDDVYVAHADQINSVAGAKLVGYFTDEPCFSMATMEWQDRFDWYPAMPYSPKLAEVFRARHGYDWAENLPHLYHEFGPESLRFRCHHWDTCNFMYAEHYFGQIYRFCEKNGYLSSGHLMREEEFEHVLSLQGGNTLRAYRNMHIPGVDWIHPVDAYPHLTSVTFKAATSMAHLRGRSRTWCESFAGAGWGLSFQEMRQIVNWEHVNGINMQIPITFKYSLHGEARTKFYAGGITWQQPYWDHFKAFADYEARICALLQGGGHVAQIALLYPSVDLWGHCWERELMKERGIEYNQFADLIRSHGYDYDIFDDDVLQGEIRIEAGQLKTNDEAFDVLVIPRVDTISLKTLRRAVEFVRGGGKLLFIGTLPRHTFEEGSDSAPLAGLLAEISPRLGTWQACGRGQVGFAATPEAAVQLLRAGLEPDLQTEGDLRDVYAFHRTLGDAELYLIFNDHPETRKLEFTLASAGRPEIWNPETGQIEPVSRYQTRKHSTTLEAEFAGYALLPIMIHRQAAGAPRADETGRELVAQVAITGPFDFSIEEVQKRPEHAWNYTEIEAVWTRRAGAEAVVPKRIELGDWSQQGLPYFSGIGHYSKAFELPEIPPGARVWLELGKVAISAAITVNGAEAGITCFEPHRLEITPWAKAGSNQLAIAVANTLSNYYAQFEELDGAALSDGGDWPERRVSGLLGPVRVIMIKATSA